MVALSIQAFLEPRGFIRGLEFIFAIAAFATVSNFEGWIGFDVLCKGNETSTHAVTLAVPYPFHMGAHVETKQVCGSATNFTFYGDFSSDAQFFVATGVLSMLWAMVTIPVYLFMDQSYRLDKRYKFADFGVTLVLATFWIAGSAAWANGLSGLKTIANPSGYVKNPEFWGNDPHIAGLTSPRGGNFASLTISVLLGFLNFIMWAGNTWFLYKEIKDDHFSNENAAPTPQPVPQATLP